MSRGAERKLRAAVILASRSDELEFAGRVHHADPFESSLISRTGSPEVVLGSTGNRRAGHSIGRAYDSK
jgi:hypothetical protein